MPKHERKSECVGWVTVEAGTEQRGADGERELRVSGYAALFDTPSERMGSFVETLDRRAFDGVLRERPDVRFLEQHDGTALARTTNDTLTLETDERGLRFEAVLDARSTRARDLFYAIERGDVSQMSFGFVIGEEVERGEGESGERLVHVTKVDRLLEVSAVTFPAYEPTSVEASEREHMVEHDEDEDDAESECDECGHRGDDCGCGTERAVRFAKARAEARRLRLG